MSEISEVKSSENQDRLHPMHVHAWLCELPLSINLHSLILEM